MNDLIFESILFCSLFSIIVYFGMGLQAAFSNFLIFTVGLLLMSIVSTSIGLLISAIITNPAAAVSSQGAVLSPFIIFSGIPTNLNTIYIWLRWVQYLSPMRLTIVRNEFSGSNDSIINSLGYDLGIANCMIILICMIIVFRVLATIFLKLSLKSI